MISYVTRNRPSIMRLGMEKNAHGSIFQIGATSTGFIIA